MKIIYSISVILSLLLFKSVFGIENITSHECSVVFALLDGRANYLFSADQSIEPTYDKLGNKRNPTGIKIKDLVDNNGNVFLFRHIDNKYEKDKLGFYAKREGGVSYSLSPSMPLMWGQDNGYILIAIQSIFTGGYRHPVRGVEKYRETDLNFLISDIQFYDEIKVPFNKENIIVIVPEGIYREILHAMPKEGFTAFDLVKKILLFGYSIQ